MRLHVPRFALLASLVIVPLVAVAFARGDEWPDPVAHHVMPYHTSGLTHGPMLGRPTATSMRAWIRTEEPSAFRVVYDDHLPLSEESPGVAGATSAETDNTGYVDVTDLKPNTRYYYGVVGKTGLVDTRMEFDRPWPSFRTLPDASSYADPLNNERGLFNFAFAIGCCARQKAQSDAEKFGIYGNPPSFLTLYKHHADEIAFHIVNGDLTYEEVLDGTPEGYAANYRLYFSRGRNVANLYRYVPLMAMFDDHEVNSNIDGSGEIGARDGGYLKRDPALAVWQHYAGWANGPSPQSAPIRFGFAEVNKGSDVLHDESADFSSLDPAQVSTIHVGHYIQGDGRTKKDRGGPNIGVYGLVEVVDRHRLRVRPELRATGRVPYSIGTHHYFERLVGNCQFIFLDTRGERSRFLGEDHAHDADRFILGKTQREWFLNVAENTPADFIFVISPDPWVIYHSGYHVRPEGGTGSKGDGFCGYVHEREQILPRLDEIEKPVLIFTGDVHNSFAVEITDNVWEFVCGPMNSAGHPIGTAGLPPFGGWFDSEGRHVKIKWTPGLADNVHYSRHRNTYYAVVQVNNIMKNARPEGIGYQFISYDEPQVVVRFHDGYTGRLAYAEGISTADAKADRTPAPKRSRWPQQVNKE